ncbi:hypothetical protein CfE428DRAFT_2377 [Chthoniobacter flavus Ellin428]|uniref:Uncharacterized protein n=1 Tax=Chthoniobacter flavus Ellin428 TaxID=497964 RepID=B4D196_9BACT|nr:hypothetical protein [Chthoniobacter flavus]EDY19788.1 hypothetical protein CfE428DRAFT_2377 [Chthoniobacter flavus Ellin428]TCO91938.1 hypothetical protein EV701_107219 [Chthoniobacter flavus]
MKICPNCEFSNDERFPTCAYCNAMIMDVPVTPSADPDDLEHERRALSETRHRTIRGQVAWAGVLYAIVIALTAATLGQVDHPLALALYAGSGLLVTFAITRNIAGQFSASLLQGILTLLLILCFGPIQLFSIFMLVGHIIVPSILWHWIELIYSANR